MTSCHVSVGSWLVISVEPRPYRSSTISIRSRRWLAESRSGPQSSEDQQIGLHQRAEQTGEAAVAVRQFEVGEELRHACVVHGVAVAAGLLRKRAGEPHR